MKPIEELQPFQTATDFLAALRPSHPQWEGDEETDTGWIFRGQSDARWRLRPSAFRRSRCNRLLLRYLRVFQRRYRDQDWEGWVQPAVARSSEINPATWSRRIAAGSLHALAQAALVRDFVLLADRAGHPTNRPDVLWHLENREDQLQWLGRFFRGEVSNDDMEAFAIAQHHGVPTGLLDWTYDPLVAAFFAAEPVVLRRGSAENQYIAVWALRSHLFKRDWQEIRRLTVTPGRVPFLDAQDGLFTWCPIAYQWHLRSGTYPTFNDVVARLGGNSSSDHVKIPLLRQLTLPVAEVPSLLKLLWREKVTRAHLMPTYDNITASLRLRSTWLK